MDLNSRQYVVSLDMTRTGSIRESFEMRHNDDNELIIELRDSDGIIDLNASGVINATLLVTRKDKVDIPLAGTITPEGRASFKLKRASLEKQGMVEVVAQFYFANDVRISTPTLIFNVLRDPSAGAVGDEGDDRTLIEIILNDAPALLDQLQTAYDELGIQKAAFAQFQSDSETAFSNAQNQRSTDFNADQAARSTAFEDAQTQRATDFNTSQGERTTLFNQAQTARQNDYQTWKDAKDTELNQLASDTENSKLAADGATVNANNAAAEALDAAEEATGAVAEVTGAKQSTVKNKTFANLDARMEESEADVWIPMKNEVVNGNFSQGASLGSREVNPSPGTIVSLDTVNFVSVPQSLKWVQNANNRYQVWDIPGNVGDKLYFATSLKKTAGSLLRIGTFPYGLSTGLTTLLTIGDEALSWNRFSVIGLSGAGGLAFTIGNGSLSTGTINIDDTIAINLSAVFGKGNEPTKEEMDRLLAKYPNSFFDGTVNLTPKLLDDLRNLTSDVQMPMTNEILNGDFSQGVFGWTPLFSTISATSNILKVTADSSGTGTPYVFGVISPYTTGDVLYYKARVRALDEGFNRFYLQHESVVLEPTIQQPSVGTWYTLSSTRKTTGNASAFVIRAEIINPIGKKYDIQYVEVINLTKIFGAGNEPTQAQMDALLATYPNSWFDGTVNLAENKRIIPFMLKRLELKANKSQELWKDATLVNGHTGFLRYRKNETQQIEIYGEITIGTAASGTLIATLPTGYRPIANSFLQAYRLATASPVNIQLGTVGNTVLRTSINTGDVIQLSGVLPV